MIRLTPSGQDSIAYNTGGGAVTTYGPFVQAADGNLYSTQKTSPTSNSSGMKTSPGGMTLFSTSTSGSGNSIYTFASPVFDFDMGATPLVAGADGALYGTTRGERPSNGACEFNESQNSGPPNYFYNCSYTIPAATVFRFSSGGVSTIHTFDSLSEGTEPLVGLVAGPDGNLYGAASASGDLGTECYTLPLANVVTVGQQVVTYADGSKVYGPPGPIRVNDEGCGTIFRISPSGDYTKMYQFQNGSEGRLSIGGAYVFTTGGMILENLSLDAMGDILGPSAIGKAGSNTDSAAQVYILPLFNNGPVQMTMNPSTVAAGTPTTVSWSVSNAFSLSAQQCYAHGVPAGSGGGTWTGKQAGVLDSSGFHGSAVITPTAAGIYSYELTCGGTESGVASLSVQ